MTAAASHELYTAYKRFTVSRMITWKPRIHANLKEMIRNVTSEPTLERAISRIDENMLKPSGLVITLMNIYTDAGRVWGGRVYQVVRKQASIVNRQSSIKKSFTIHDSRFTAKALMPIGRNEEMI